MTSLVDYYKGTEKLLYHYPFLKENYLNKKREIEDLTEDGLAGTDYESINCITNKISSSVETAALRNIERFNAVRREMKLMENKLLSIENSMELLGELEREIVKLRYIDKESVDYISDKLCLSRRQTIRLKKQAINSLKVSFFGLKAIQEECPLFKLM